MRKEIETTIACLYEEELSEEDERMRENASLHMRQAFENGKNTGIDDDFLAYAALSSAFGKLTEIYGEETIVAFAECLPERLRRGDFFSKPTYQ